MKSHEFITEAEVTPYKSEKLSPESAAHILTSYCSDAISAIDTPIWRGMNNHYESLLFIDPSTGVRKSQNTSNHYTELIDNSPYYVGWPKRSQSLICTTKMEYARTMGRSSGSAYAVYPVDGAKIAVCNTDDFWGININLEIFGLTFYDDASRFNFFLLDELGCPDKYSLMVEHVKTAKFEYLMKRHLLDKFKDSFTPDQFIPYLQKKLSPEVLGFTLLTLPELIAAKNRNTEVWFDDPAVAVRVSGHKRELESLKILLSKDVQPLNDTETSIEDIDHTEFVKYLTGKTK